MVGVVLAQVLGLGIVLLVLVTKRFDVHQVEAVLFGGLITLNDRDLAVLASTALLVGPFLLFWFNRSVLTLVVVASLKVVGALLVLVLIVMPTAAAQNIARTLWGFFWCSVLFGTVSALSALSGLLLSAIWPVPTGGAIVFAASVLFYATMMARPLVGRASVQQGEI